MKTFFLLAGLLTGLMLPNLQAQELRLQASMSILGEINNPFVGLGAGFENPMGSHFSVNIDAMWASQEIGSTLEFRPAVHYYLGREHRGLYVGPAFKYIRLNESGESSDRYADNLYAPGFNLGVKSKLGDFGSLSLNLNPHVTVGGSQESNVAGMSAQVALGYSF